VTFTPPGRLFDWYFRASADYELRPLRRRGRQTRRWFGALDLPGRVAGVLRPVRPGPPVRAVDRAAARLLREVRQPRRLPSGTRATLGPRREQTIAALVLDGVLEVERGGAFISGPAAHPLFFRDADPPAPASPLARLSLQALQYAASLDLADARTLASRLYRFNTFPASPNARRRWPNADTVAAFLRLDRYASDPKVVSSTTGAWHAWRVRRARYPSRREPCYKLYLSPHADGASVALREVLAWLGDAHALECKIGRDLHGLLRPDKLIVYFRTLAALRAAAKRWARALAGMPVQGVPFTADIGGDGLLSWGMDPPDVLHGRLRRSPLSWREWVTRHLAEAVVTAQRSPGTAVPPSRFALDRVALDGVDTRTWTPSPWLRRTAAFG
jgi:hypothetical protein